MGEALRICPNVTVPDPWAFQRGVDRNLVKVAVTGASLATIVLSPRMTSFPYTWCKDRATFASGVQEAEMRSHVVSLPSTDGGEVHFDVLFGGIRPGHGWGSNGGVLAGGGARNAMADFLAMSTDRTLVVCAPSYVRWWQNRVRNANVRVVTMLAGLCGAFDRLVLDRALCSGWPSALACRRCERVEARHRWVLTPVEDPPPHKKWPALLRVLHLQPVHRVCMIDPVWEDTIGGTRLREACLKSLWRSLRVVLPGRVPHAEYVHVTPERALALHSGQGTIEGLRRASSFPMRHSLTWPEMLARATPQLPGPLAKNLETLGETECMICYTDLSAAPSVVLRCGHCLCGHCREHVQECPVCRSSARKYLDEELWISNDPCMISSKASTVLGLLSEAKGKTLVMSQYPQSLESLSHILRAEGREHTLCKSRMRSGQVVLCPLGAMRECSFDSVVLLEPLYPIERHPMMVANLTTEFSLHFIVAKGSVEERLYHAGFRRRLEQALEAMEPNPVLVQG